MAPFPQADHCIGPDQDAEALYRRYGGLFQALVGAKWLLRAHAANVTLIPSWSRSILTETYLCHACSCQEILRTETAGQVT
eukprot:COSAG01_NODE_14591_length_1435_cov_1.172904_3_plen_80_part_01